MLVNMNHVLRYAQEKQCCIGAFDTPNLEILMAVIRAAEKREEPVIIQHAQLHECEMPIPYHRPHHGAYGEGRPGFLSASCWTTARTWTM